MVVSSPCDTTASIQGKQHPQLTGTGHPGQGRPGGRDNLQTGELTHVAAQGLRAAHTPHKAPGPRTGEGSRGRGAGTVLRSGIPQETRGDLPLHLEAESQSSVLPTQASVAPAAVARGGLIGDAHRHPQSLSPSQCSGQPRPPATHREVRSPSPAAQMPCAQTAPGCTQGLGAQAVGPLPSWHAQLPRASVLQSCSQWRRVRAAGAQGRPFCRDSW